MTTSPVTAGNIGRSPGRRLLALGLALAVLGMGAYVLQVAAGRLTTPWYLPVVTSLALFLVLAALWQKRGVWRFLALVPVGLVTAVAWALVLGGRLPAYEGPAAGDPFPSFATKRADGTPFTRRDLEGDRDNVLVFFRGRW